MCSSDLRAVARTLGAMRSFLAPKQSPRGEADAKATARKSMDELDLNVKGLREKQDNQQLKTFTRWWNSWLQMRGIKLDDLVNDTKTGVAAMNLIELLSSSLVGKYNSDPKMRFHYLENQLAFLQQLKQKNIRLVNIGAEDLVEGNKTLILGLTWTLILRYEIQKYGAEVVAQRVEQLGRLVGARAERLRVGGVLGELVLLAARPLGPVVDARVEGVLELLGRRAVRRALGPQPRHLLRARAEYEHVLLANLLRDLDVGAVHGADDEAAVHRKLHVGRPRRLCPRSGDVLRQLRPRDDHLCE